MMLYRFSYDANLPSTPRQGGGEGSYCMTRFLKAYVDSPIALDRILGLGWTLILAL